jgi:hypothetical protein
MLIGVENRPTMPLSRGRRRPGRRGLVLWMISPETLTRPRRPDLFSGENNMQFECKFLGVFGATVGPDMEHGRSVIRLYDLENGDAIMVKGLSYTDLCDLQFAIATHLRTPAMRVAAGRVGDPIYHHGEPA